MPLTIAITGAAGNVGAKLVTAFAGANWCEHVIAIDVVARASSAPKVTWVEADLVDRADRRWTDRLGEADAVLHLAILNRGTAATWQDAIASTDMTLNVSEVVACAPGVKRLVFASSNQVMGGYAERVRRLPTGALTGETPVRPGLVLNLANGSRVRSESYAAGKVFDERIVRERVLSRAGDLAGVCIRVGWRPPGEDRALGPGQWPVGDTAGGHWPADDAGRAWFRGMWLSNRDLVQLFERAVLASSADWPSPFLTVNGVSRNAGSVWDLEDARRWLQYEPADDVANWVAPT